MKRISIILLLAVILLAPLSARTVSQEIIPLSSSVYSDMDLLYLITGNGTPSNARPWTKTEAFHILHRVDPLQLEGAGEALYHTLLDGLSDSPTIQEKDGFLLDIGFTYNLEGYYHSNGEDFTKDTDWIYGFEDRKPMFKFDIGFGIDPFFYSFTDLQYSRNRFTDRDIFNPEDDTAPPVDVIGSIIEEGNTATIVEHSHIYSQRFMSNVLIPTYDVDFQTPKRAVISFGGAQWNMNLSRDRVKWGNGHSGNFIIDDHVDYHEFARVSGFTNRFKYDLLYVFFETNPSTSEGSSADEEFRMLMAHRLEFRILDNLTFAVSENIMYRNDVLNLRYLNPANVYHNLNSRRLFNAIAHVELDYSPIPKVNIYGQYVLDQAVAPNESASQADATGFLVGVEYATPLKKGILSTSLEFAQTSPAMYRREYVDFLMFRRYHGNGTSFVSHIDYIGYQYGGDTQLIQWDVGLRLLPAMQFNFRVIGMRQGKVDYSMSNDDVNEIRDPTPYGDTVTERGIITLGGELSYPNLFSALDAALWFQVDLVGQRVYDRTTETYGGHIGDVQVSLGVGLSL